MGPTIARIQTDFLGPTIERTFRLLWRNGKLPKMPDVVKENQGSLEIEYVGALAKTQEATNMANVERWVGLVGSLAQVNEEVLDVVDWDGLVKDAALMLGVPAKMMRDQAEVDAEREQRRAQQAAMQQAMVAEQQGKAGQALAEAEQVAA